MGILPGLAIALPVKSVDPSLFTQLILIGRLISLGFAKAGAQCAPYILLLSQSL